MLECGIYARMTKGTSMLPMGLGHSIAVASDHCDEIAVIIPVYAGRPFLRELCARIAAALEPISPHFSIVLVDDRSGDNVWDLIQEVGRDDRRIKGIQLSRNFGQHHALTAGVDYARAHWYVVMDCDLQDAPEDIPLLYEKAREGFDMVIGISKRQGHAGVKRLASFLFYTVFNKMAGINLAFGAGNFRIFSESVATGLRQIREQLRCLPATLSFMGFDIAEVQTQHHPRSEGKSSYSLRKLASLATNTILAHSELPLKITAFFGLTVAGFSILGGLLILARTIIFGSSVTGWASLIISVFIVGGVQIFSIGVVGIYVGKTFEEAKRRPLYFVRDTVNLNPRAQVPASIESHNDLPSADELPSRRAVSTQ
jgi:glycosyltransferase involved in cell wall biosynthesis